MNTWHYLHTDVALLAFTKTNGEFDFELHYECRGMHLLKERIERFLSELALLKGPAVTALSQFDAFTLIRESWEQIQNVERIWSAALHHLYMFLFFGYSFGTRARSP